MGEKRVLDLFNIKARFLRSAQLERDFHDPDAFAAYVPTDFILSCLTRVASGLKPGSGQRAWRMTGDYGSGKSSFALLLAHWFAGRDSAFPSQIRKVVDFRRLGVRSPQFVPALVTCSRQPLGVSVLQALHRALVENYGRGQKFKLAVEVQQLLDGKQELSEELVLETVLKVNSRIIADSKGRGLMLILDELGKFLEFAALHPQRQDVFLLQRLAETASRSGDEPLFVVCLLHQGFNAYADYLNQSAQREWEKVAGRFDEIVFNQPVEQLAGLITSALNVRTNQLPSAFATTQKQAMDWTIRLGWFGSAPTKELQDLAALLYPLHPTVLPVLIRAFRRFGQNERSLFSFLLSNEPFGLLAFSSQRIEEAEPYRLHDFYDYVRTNFGHRLAVQSYRSHWNLIDSLIESFATEDQLQIKVLKTVGILNLLNDGDLIPAEDAILCAVAGESPAQHKQLRAALEKLRTDKRVLYDRGKAGGLCLWPHSSVDLEKAYEDARRATDTPRRVATLIKDYLETRPVVARRHYIETGNLRHFDVRYCSVFEMEAALQDNTTDSDGTIVIPLCETEQERDAALALAKLPALKDRPNWLCAVPQPLNNLASLVQEVQRWDWVSTNTLELNADKYAREEVTRQKTAARSQLERRVQSIIGFKQLTGQMSLDWFHETRPLRITSGRRLLENLSSICDETYPLAPRIHNELVNRRTLSSAAAAARMRLIERMFTDGHTEWLGMNPSKKPPEMSMYLSVLQNSGLHQRHGDAWCIGEPHHKTDETCRVLPTLRRIRQILREQPDNRVNISALFVELRKPPYGLRDGLIPLLLTVFAIAHEQDVAFFKDGTFQRELTGEMMLVLTKAPERFDIQYCRIEGVRAELFEKLLAVVEVKPSPDRKAELLDVVKPLCVFVARLPAYALNTRKLTPTGLAVRETILNAREPAALLFTDLPKACGFEPFDAATRVDKSASLFVKALKVALDELRAVFPELEDRLKKRLRDAFDLPGSFQQFRAALASRAQQVVLDVTEPKLKALCLRLLDDTLPEAQWLESVGSHLALKPPSKWHDAEEDLFNQELAEIATRFHRVESIVFAHGQPSKHGIAIRLAITQANGVEHEQVIHFTADEEQRMRDIQTQFETLLTKDKRLGLAAASRALWSNLEKGGKVKDE
jgi:hypothetical protein